jgi:hypothetical protein
MDEDDLIDQARRVEGLYAGQCDPSEYDHLIEAGLLRMTYSGVGGLMGLAKLERVIRREEPTE